MPTRNIVNISLPITMAEEIKMEVGRRQFASVSEYIRHLIRSDKLYRELEEDRKQFQAGRYKVLKSLSDLE